MGMWALPTLALRLIRFRNIFWLACCLSCGALIETAGNDIFLLGMILGVILRWIVGVRGVSRTSSSPSSSLWKKMLKIDNFILTLFFTFGGADITWHRIDIKPGSTYAWPTDEPSNLQLRVCLQQISQKFGKWAMSSCLLPLPILPLSHSLALFLLSVPQKTVFTSTLC